MWHTFQASLFLMLDYVGKSPFSLSDTTDYVYVHKTVNTMKFMLLMMAGFS